MDKLLSERVKDLLPDAEPAAPLAGYRLHVSFPYIAPGSKENVLRAIDEAKISSATSIVAEFEENLKQFFGVRFAKACSSGYSALVLALRLANVGEGDEVLIPSLTMAAVLNAVLTVGAKPVFVDCAPGGNFNPSVVEYEQKANKCTHVSALIVCHTYGVPADCTKIQQFCKSKQIVFIEDIAEAIGADYNGRLVGTFGDFSCASLYANKAITSGDGGFLLGSRDLKDNADSYVNHGFTKKFHFVHYEHSGNYKMSGLQAAFVSPAVSKLPEVMSDRTRIGNKYREALREVCGLQLMPRNEYGRDAPWVFGVLVTSKAVRTRVRGKLASKGIETRDFFFPLHLQPMTIARQPKTYPETLPNAEYLGSCGFYLPTFYGMKDEDIDFVSSCLREAMICDPDSYE